MAIKKEAQKQTSIPPLVLRRTQLPCITEEFSIYPKETGAYCATCYVKYLKDGLVIIDIKSRSDEKWYFYSLSENQKKEFLDSLIQKIGLEGLYSELMVDIGDFSYHISKT
jgi:hypothetical protein